LILSARTSDGAVANVLAVNAGSVESGLVQSDVLADAVAGKGSFRKAQTHVRVIAALFPEDVHLVVARGAHVAKVSDLKGKRVSLGADGSGTSVTARAILAAYGISPSAIKARHDPSDVDAQLLRDGKLDAFFFVGGTPVPLMDDLLGHGAATLVPIDGKHRAKLLGQSPSLFASTIPAGTYSGIGAVETVGVRALWVVRDSVPNAIVYGIVRSLFNPVNREQLGTDDVRSAHYIRLDTATLSLTAPLHPGAARFYREAGKL
jgi:TRAP transporter TAXI family solute receptor